MIRREILKLTILAGAASVSNALLGFRRRAWAAPPVWSTIPNQNWTVGVPVSFDLADFVNDPDGDALIYSLEETLPPGLTLEGSVITGTPTTVSEAAPFVATVDDGEIEDTVRPAPPSNLRVD